MIIKDQETVEEMLNRIENGIGKYCIQDTRNTKFIRVTQLGLEKTKQTARKTRTKQDSCEYN